MWSESVKRVDKAALILLLLFLLGVCSISASTYWNQEQTVKRLESSLILAQRQNMQVKQRVQSLVLHSHQVERQNQDLTLRLHTAAQKATMLSSRGTGLDTPGASQWGNFKATWYSCNGGVGDGTVTRTGTKVKDNWTIAVDPRVIPLGSIVEVRFANGSTRLYQALDTGRAIEGNRIDIFDSSEARCKDLGVQAVDLRVIVNGAPIAVNS